MADLQAASLTFSILAFLTSAIGILLVYFPGIRDTFTSVFDRTSTGSFSGILSLLGAFSPDIALLSGFISDIMNGSFRFSVTSLVGIIAVILHGIVGGFFFGFTKSASVSSIVPTLTEVIGVGEEAAVVGGDSPSTLAAARRERVSRGKPPAGPRSGAMSALRLGTPAGSVVHGTGSARPSREAAIKAAARIEMYNAMGRRHRNPGRSASVASSGGSRPTRGGDRDEPESQSGGARSAVLSNFNPCAIRGLGFLDVKGSPMGMAALAAIFMVYLLDMTTKKSPATIGGYLAFSFVVFGLNLFAYSELECVADTSYVGLLKAISLPTAIGLVTGGIAYGVMKANYKSFLPLDPEGFQPGAPGNQPQCGKPSDNEFVCDAYKDGKRISTAVVS